MATAFVLSGGANLGAVQVGMLRALHEADIRPDLLVGASVGALNAAWLAGAEPDEGVNELAEIWTSLRRGDVFPVRFGLGLSGFLGHRSSLIDAGGLCRLIRSHIRFERIEDAPIPLHVVVTDVLDGSDVALSSGTAAGYACSLASPPTSALAMTLHAVSLMINRRLAADVDHYLGRADVRVVPPPCPVDVKPSDFSRARELIDRTYASTVAWLDHGSGTCSANPLLDHDHRARR